MRAVYYLLPILVLLTGAKAPRPAATPVDNPQALATYTVSADRHFHVDDFAGLDPSWTPISGSKSLWCGVRPDPAICWPAPGYGQNTVQQFESRQFAAGASHHVNVTFSAKWDVETSYDFIYLERRTDSADWAPTQVLNGPGSGQLSIGANALGWVQFRVRVVSDFAFDAEDGFYALPNGAIVIDDLVVSDGFGNILDTQTFESEAVGDVQTTDFDWIADDPYVVTSSGDSGPGTLREGIDTANASSSVNRIVFGIPCCVAQTISPLSPLPPITDFLVIDGYTQVLSSPNTNPVGSPSNAVLKIELSGVMAGYLSSGLVFQAAGCRVRGLAINWWGQNGVLAQAPDIYVHGNFIGTDLSGNTGAPNSAGIRTPSNRCRIGGCSPAFRNIIGGNNDGVVVEGTSLASSIFGNYVGVGANLSTPVGNTYGIRIKDSADRTGIGSHSRSNPPEPWAKNIFANNYSFGVILEGTTPTTNYIIGNSFHEEFRAIEIGNGPPPEATGVLVYDATGTQMYGHAFGPPNKSVSLHFYRSSECGGPWGTGYAEVYIGRGTALSDAGGIAPYTYTLTQPLPPGCWITATATFAVPSNTSELSVCRQYQNTPGGGSVTVDLLDDEMNVHGTVAYSQVTSPGNTFLANPYDPPVPLSGYFSVPDPDDPAIYFDITTTASYDGSIEVCLSYDESSLPGDESEIVLVHYNGSSWEDVTSDRDPDNNRICGKVESLSPFVIAVPIPSGIEEKPVPISFALGANIPNPFNPITTIHYDVPAGGADVNISIYDVAGRMVRELVDQHRAPGTWSVQWNGDDDRGRRVASGVYFYRMRAGEFVETRKMVLLK